MKILIKILLWFVVTLTSLTLLLYIFNFDYLITAVRITYLNGHKTAFLDAKPNTNAKTIFRQKNFTTVPEFGPSSGKLSVFRWGILLLKEIFGILE